MTVALLYYDDMYDTIHVYYAKVSGAMEIALFIQNIQEERAEVALHIFSSQSNDTSMNRTMAQQKGLTERFRTTDRALEDMPTWPDVRTDKFI